ncbi:hypothetical protein RUND412_008723 [Rhizina undulata]
MRIPVVRITQEEGVGFVFGIMGAVAAFVWITPVFMMLLQFFGLAVVRLEDLERGNPAIVTKTVERVVTVPVTFWQTHVDTSTVLKSVTHTRSITEPLPAATVTRTVTSALKLAPQELFSELVDLSRAQRTTVTVQEQGVFTTTATYHSISTTTSFKTVTATTTKTNTSTSTKTVTYTTTRNLIDRVTKTSTTTATKTVTNVSTSTKTVTSRITRTSTSTVTKTITYTTTKRLTNSVTKTSTVTATKTQRYYG